MSIPQHLKQMDEIYKYLNDINFSIPIDEVAKHFNLGIYNTSILLDRMAKDEYIIKNDVGEHYPYVSINPANPDLKGYIARYKEQEKKDKTESIKNWKERNWFLLAAGAYLLGCFTPSVEKLFHESPKQQTPIVLSKQDTPFSHSDTSRIIYHSQSYLDSLHTFKKRPQK
jgi:hypothetical protein